MTGSLALIYGAETVFGDSGFDYMGGGARPYEVEADITNYAAGQLDVYVSLYCSTLNGGTVTMTNPELLIKTR